MQTQNPLIGQIFRDEAKTTLSEGFPQNISSSIQPVLDISPSLHKYPTDVKTTEPTTSGSTNLAATTSDVKRTFLHGIAISYAKDATCDAADGQYRARCVINGVSKIIISFPLITLTAQSASMYVQFDRPMLVDKSSALSITQPTFTVGKFLRNVCFHVSEEE